MRKLVVFAVLLAAAAPLAAQTVTHFAADLPTYSTRLAQTPFVVTALDANNQKVANYHGTVTFSSSLAGPDSSVDLPANYTFTDADAGTHTFTVVFHRGYLHEVWVTDTVTGAQGADQTNVLCPEMTLSATNSGPMCPGSSVTLSASSNAQNPTYFWELVHGGGGLVLNGQTVTTTAAGTWEVHVTDGVDGCTAAVQTVVAYEAAPSISSPGTAGGDFTASIAGDGNGPYTNIDWSVTSGGSIASGQGTATVTIHPSPGVTRVDFGVTATRSSTGCRQSNTASTAIVAPLSAAISTSSALCPNADGTASVPDTGSGATYLWSLTNASILSGQGMPSIVFRPTTRGTVQIAATVTRNGNSATGNATVAVSGPSATIVSDPTPAVCAGSAATIDVLLAGTPPFTLTWSDGMMQSGIMGNAVSRTVAPDMSTAYSIASVSDASCSGSTSGVVHAIVLGAPDIARDPENQTVRPHGSATLTVVAGGDLLTFEWFEGERGDVSTPVGTNSAKFDTPPVDRPVSYWVRVSNACGSVSSAAATISPARGRAARH